MNENPFESPQPVQKEPVATVEYQHDGSGRGYVRQISVIAWLLMIHGVMMSMFALMCVGFWGFMANIETMMPPDQRAQFEQDFPVDMVAGVYGVWGLLSAVLGPLQIVAGFLNLDFRARPFGIVTLFLGLASIVTCYCAPTGLGLCVYGLIIYFSPAAAEAFRLRSTGLSKQQVMTQFVR